MVTLINKMTGKKFKFPSLPDKAVTITAETSYQKYEIIDNGEYNFPSGSNQRSVDWKGTFFGKHRSNISGLITEFQEPWNCVRTLESWRNSKAPLTLKVSEACINMDVTIKKFVYKPTGGHGDIEYTISFKEYEDIGNKEYEDIGKPVGSNRNGKKKEKYYTVKKNHHSRHGICKIAKKYYGKTSKWKKIYDKNKKIIEKKAKKHGRKNSSQGKYLYNGTRLTIPS